MVANTTGWVAGFFASGFVVRTPNHLAPGNAAFGDAIGRHRRSGPERSVSVVRKDRISRKRGLTVLRLSSVLPV
jgi:hypothetical protein